MASTGDYQSFGATNEPDTCLWCGRKLVHKSRMCEEGDPGAFRVGGEGRGGWWARKADKGGGYSDGMFCGLRCGYQFGKRMAEFGERLRQARGRFPGAPQDDS